MTGAVVDRIEPRQDADWQAMEFRRKGALRGNDSGDSRFAIGVGIFLLVAALYPWYSYKVVTFLLAKDATEALSQFGRETKAAGDALSEQLALDQQELTQASAERRAARELAAVKVMGVSESGNRPLVLVNLGSASLHDVDAEVCRQASRWLRRNLSGVVIRVQRTRGNSPAVDAGEIVCGD